MYIFLPVRSAKIFARLYFLFFLSFQRQVVLFLVLYIDLFNNSPANGILIVLLKLFQFLF